MSDERREAAADAAAAKARAKALRPWYKKKRFLLPLALLAVIVISVAAGGSQGTKDVATKADDAVEGATEGVRSESANEDNPPANDVTLDRCEVGDTLNYPEASGTIHNNSSQPSNYSIHVDFLQGGRRVADGTAFETEVQPSQDLDWETTGLKEVNGAVECKVTRVERYAS